MTLPTPEIEVTIPSQDASLDGRLAQPVSPRAGVVLCNPHPAFGGTMDASLIVVLARALAAKGYATLRFDFRGVRRSTGTASGGDHEGADVLAAAAFLKERGIGPIGALGQSFGAAAVLDAVWREGDFAAVACVGFPTESISPGAAVESRIRATIARARRLLFISGTQDPYSSPELLESWGGKVERLLAVGHFYSPREEQQILAIVERLFLAATVRPA